jgi:hypothetical protein
MLRRSTQYSSSNIVSRLVAHDTCLTPVVITEYNLKTFDKTGEIEMTLIKCWECKYKFKHTLYMPETQ